MDFHSLTRRELQALCKKNGIPANITNVAMADALTALHSTVQGNDEISDSSKSVSVQSSVESPERAEVTSPRVPRTRTTRKKVESTTAVNKATTTTRRVTRNKKDGVAPMNIDVNFSEVDNQSEISKGKEACIPQTPSMVLDTRKRSSRVETTTTKAYGTRRSTRLAVKTSGHTDTSEENKEKPDAANMKLFSADCGDNFEMNDNECSVDLSEDVPSTVINLKEDASDTSKCEEILSNYSAVDIPNDFGHESPKESNKSAEKVKLDGENGTLGNIWNKETKGEDINEEANIENKDEIIVENDNDTNQQALVEMKDEVAGNNGEFYEDGGKLNGNVEIVIGGVEVCGVDIKPNDDNDDGNLVSKMMDMSLTSQDGVITQIEDHDGGILVPNVNDGMPLGDNGGMLAETENYAIGDEIVVDEFVPKSEEEEHVFVNVAAGEHVDKVDCDEPSQEYSKKDELLPKPEVEDLVNGSMLTETENHAISDAIVVDESAHMSEEEEHVLVKDAAAEQVDKIDCGDPSQEYSNEDELLPKSGPEDLVNVAAGEQLVNSEGESLFDLMLSGEDEEDLVNVSVGKQLASGESGKPSQENSKDDEFSPKSVSMEESSEEEGSEDESEEESEDEESEEESGDDESEEESGDDESEEESEEVDLVNAAIRGQLVKRDSDKPSELISKVDLPKTCWMEEYKEEEGSKDESEEVEDVVKVAAGPQLDKKPSENSEEDANSKASIFVDEAEGIPVPAITALPTPGKKNPNAVVIGKENLDKLSIRQIRKMIKGLNINDDSKNDKKDNSVKKSDEELVETASRRPALQMLPENQH